MDTPASEPKRVPAPATLDGRGNLYMVCPGCKTEYGLCGVFTIYCVPCGHFLVPDFGAAKAE